MLGREENGEGGRKGEVVLKERGEGEKEKGGRRGVRWEEEFGRREDRWRRLKEEEEAEENREG